MANKSAATAAAANASGLGNPVKKMTFQKESAAVAPFPASRTAQSQHNQIAASKVTAAGAVAFDLNDIFKVNIPFFNQFNFERVSILESG